MAEWLILLFLIPAITVPAVLLLGFAGCTFRGSGVPSPDVSATVISSSAITLTWSFEDPVDHFNIQRTLPGPPPDMVDFETPLFSYDDTGLAPATTYQYQVQGANTNNNPVGGSSVVSATTPGLNITQNDSFGHVGTRTVKCEIASDLVPPSFAPARMWITLGQWALVPDAESITFSKVFIGHQADQVAGVDRWDATSLTPVLFGGAESTVITPGNTSRSDEIAFAWDGTALILSMFFEGGTTPDALTARTGTGSATHLKDAAGDEAGPPPPDPAGYTSYDGFLSGVVKIEVAP